VLQDLVDLLNSRSILQVNNNDQVATESDKSGNKWWLHDLLQDSQLITPSETTDPVNNEYQKRLNSLRSAVDKKRYQKMVQNITGIQDCDDKESGVGSELANYNQYISLGTNLLVSMFTSFMVAYWIVNRTYGNQTWVCNIIYSAKFDEMNHASIFIFV
jgi:hypothetical protein